MKRLGLFLLITALFPGIADAQQPAAAPIRPAAQVPLEEAVVDFYVVQFSIQMELTDEQAINVLSLLRRALRMRRDAVAQRIAAEEDLLRLIQAGAPDAQIRRQLEVLDRRDAEARNFEIRFRNAVSPHLTPMQQAKLRIVLPNIEQRIQQLIQQARQTNLAQQQLQRQQQIEARQQQQKQQKQQQQQRGEAYRQ